MSTASRIPLASSTASNARESALLRSTAQKIKRKSIGPAAVANSAKRARALPTRPPTPIDNSAGPARPLSRPLGSSMLVGRATTTGIPPRSALRPPSTLSSRQRLGSAVVDAEKEEMRKKIEELEREKEEKGKEIHELRMEKCEWRSEKSDLKEKLTEKKAELEDSKTTIKELKKDVADLKEDLTAEKENHKQTKVNKDQCIERMKKELIDKDDQMRGLHNDVVDLRGRIRVSVRVRRLLATEGDESTHHLSYPDETSIGIEMQAGKVQPFTFDHVYGPNYSQIRIFNGVKELIMSVLHGYNVSLISYGQTGSGKTYTMRGGEDDAAGLIPRAVKYIFENRRRLEDIDWSFEFAASFLEVYNNECYDLLSTPPRAKREIKQVNNRFVVDGLCEEKITDATKMASLLRKSDANRSTAATKCNENSSRSHAIFSLAVKGTNGTTGAKIDSVLKLVDLAGSERAKESGATGDRFTEMTHINTALSNLQTCIRGILTKQSHIPYRNSKLTTLLQDSLSGGSKCMVILSLAPSLHTINETKRTLDFGRNLSQTHIGVAKKKES